MDVEDLLFMLQKEQERRAAGGKTTFEDLMAESQRILKSGQALRYAGGPGCDRGDAIIYAYDKDGVIQRRCEIHCSADIYRFGLKLFRLQRKLVKQGFRPKVYLPYGLTSEPVRRTRAEIEYDEATDPSNMWTTKPGVAPMSGSCVWGSGPLKLSGTDQA